MFCAPLLVPWHEEYCRVLELNGTLEFMVVEAEAEQELIRRGAVWGWLAGRPVREHLEERRGRDFWHATFRGGFAGPPSLGGWCYIAKTDGFLCQPGHICGWLHSTEGTTKKPNFGSSYDN